MRGLAKAGVTLATLLACLGGFVAVNAQTSNGPTKGVDGKTTIITLQPNALVEQPIVTLGAVASIQGGEPWQRKLIASLDVAEITSVGRAVTISRDQVALRIQLAGIDL